ncbi:MOSC and FAD-binding oxidoreductase domain-containing protein [Planotetraspora sp. A-T 1434]|uniref:MOSC and FAD-binding oxidoreductase domain-containing protein n=1 Tax=Planotetraspora sp. A-T 1434 TaxID=2979219 RepID=UPI0021C1517B|nr:MOSC and FAD-binding oxidoreductase domain-containing protein [Planotetraspora sp. A-T 1434]MCT9930397.1 MOSC and FAD-binding oxidoreductase domain-containing protein [Planotetraspora sp. A-T 1434]
MAKLLAVNVGMPRDVSWRGRTVHTGVWKRPVTGPRMVRRLNIDGDGQGDLAGHGGEQRAVLVYQLDSYRYWRRQLNRDDLGYGQFGENFTVDGLPDDEVCVGDRFRIGEAVFEVTQPRVTCYRVGLRLGEPRMASLLVAHRRPGFYLRVLTEGHVEAGDDIVKIADGPEGMTVAEIDALLYLPGHPREQLVRALRIPALSPGWQTSFRALLDQADGASGRAPGNAGLTSAAGPPPAWEGFRPLRVTRIDAESASVFSLVLSDVDGAPLPAALAGQFITVRLRPAGSASPLVRSYSMSGPPGSARYRISVKHEPHGAASTHLRIRVRIGDVLDVAAPRGAFTLKAGDNPVLLVSAGIGATPVLAMLHELAGTRSPREVWWLHGARDGTEHPFARETRDLLARLPNAREHVCYSRPAPGDRQGVDYQTAGRLSLDLFRRLGVPRRADIYLCGPPSFMEHLPAALASSDLAPAGVHTEVFGAGPAMTPGLTDAPRRPAHPPAGQPGEGPTVSFARSGLTVAWDPAYGSLLELAEACDVPTRWSCRTGVCHNCESGLLSGTVAYSPEPIDAPAQGNVLICCSRPQDAIALDL